MTTKKKTINQKRGEVTSPSTPKKKFNVSKAFALREQLINEMAAYCAEISQILLVDFAENVAIELDELHMNKQLFDTLQTYEKRINEKGLYLVGNEVLLAMRKLVA